MVHSEYELQTIVSQVCQCLFCLVISLSKTAFMHQPTPGSAATPPSINVDGTELLSIDYFKYWESIIFSDSTLDKEIEA